MTNGAIPMTEQVTLLPCPFCGESPQYEARIGKFAPTVSCVNKACGIKPMSSSLDPAYAKARWNTRHSKQPPVEGVRSLLAKARGYVEEAGFRHHDVTDLLREIDAALAAPVEGDEALTLDNAAALASLPRADRMRLLAQRLTPNPAKTVDETHEIIRTTLEGKLAISKELLELAERDGRMVCHLLRSLAAGKEQV